jgi:hypothetical protein
MKKVLRWLKIHAWSVWLGGGFTLLTGLDFMTWQWWAFCIPVILFVGLSEYERRMGE